MRPRPRLSVRRKDLGNSSDAEAGRQGPQHEIVGCGRVCGGSQSAEAAHRRRPHDNRITDIIVSDDERDIELRFQDDVVIEGAVSGHNFVTVKHIDIRPLFALLANDFFKPRMEPHRRRRNHDPFPAFIGHNRPYVVLHAAIRRHCHRYETVVAVQ